MTPSRTAAIQSTTLELVQGDITKQKVDAIVNAANSSLLGGGGVDGAIHRAAGHKLVEETKTLGGCATGDAKITAGYNLSAKHVIHAVGPVYNPNNPEVPKLLSSAYVRSLEVAAENNLVSVAFPAISTGVYRYPLDKAATIALDSVYQIMSNDEKRRTLHLVRFVLFTENIYVAFEKALQTLALRVDDVTLD